MASSRRRRTVFDAATGLHPEREELILFACELMKCTRRGKEQQRVLVLTDFALYTLTPMAGVAASVRARTLPREGPRRGLRGGRATPWQKRVSLEALTDILRADGGDTDILIVFDVDGGDDDEWKGMAPFHFATKATHGQEIVVNQLTSALAAYRLNRNVEERIESSSAADLSAAAASIVSSVSREALLDRKSHEHDKAREAAMGSRNAVARRGPAVSFSNPISARKQLTLGNAERPPAPAAAAAGGRSSDSSSTRPSGTVAELEAPAAAAAATRRDFNKLATLPSDSDDDETAAEGVVTESDSDSDSEYAVDHDDVPTLPPAMRDEGDSARRARLAAAASAGGAGAWRRYPAVEARDEGRTLFFNTETGAAAACAAGELSRDAGPSAGDERYKISATVVGKLFASGALQSVDEDEGAKRALCGRLISLLDDATWEIDQLARKNRALPALQATIQALRKTNNALETQLREAASSASAARLAEASVQSTEANRSSVSASASASVEVEAQEGELDVDSNAFRRAVLRKKLSQGIITVEEVRLFMNHSCYCCFRPTFRLFISSLSLSPPSV